MRDPVSDQTKPKDQVDNTKKLQPGLMSGLHSMGICTSIHTHTRTCTKRYEIIYAFIQLDMNIIYSFGEKKCLKDLDLLASELKLNLFLFLIHTCLCIHRYTSSMPNDYI